MALTPEERRERERDRQRRRRAANPEAAREEARAWRAANPEKVRAAQKAYRDSHPEEIRARRAADAEANREYQRAYYASRKAAKRAQGQAYYRANREQVLMRTQRSRLARLHGMRPEELVALWNAQQGRCYLCGQPLGVPGSRGTDLDHDHRCCGPAQSCRYCRRGLACHCCNVIVGFAEDDVDRLLRVAENLRAAVDAVTERLKDRPHAATLFDTDLLAEGGA